MSVYVRDKYRPRPNVFLKANLGLVNRKAPSLDLNLGSNTSCLDMAKFTGFLMQVKTIHEAAKDPDGKWTTHTHTHTPIALVHPQRSLRSSLIEREHTYTPQEAGER